jgi:hypothetical protein
MIDLIAEWAKYCEGKSKHDEWDFIGLLSRKWTDDDLNKILRLVPLRDAVIANLREVYLSSEEGRHVYLRPKRANAAAHDVLKSSIVSFIDSQRRYLLKHAIDEETRAWLKRTEIEVSFVSNHQLRSVDPNDDVRPFIREEESEHRRYRLEAGVNITTADSIEYRVMAGIQEALYGLASDYYLAWFVLSPLFDTEVDYGKYFEFWKHGGAYALTDSQILVASLWGDGDE